LGRATVERRSLRIPAVTTIVARDFSQPPRHPRAKIDTEAIAGHSRFDRSRPAARKRSSVRYKAE